MIPEAAILLRVQNLQQSLSSETHLEFFAVYSPQNGKVSTQETKDCVLEIFYFLDMLLHRALDSGFPKMKKWQDAPISVICKFQLEEMD